MLSFFIKDSSGYILEFESLKKGILFSKANYLKPFVTNVNLKDDIPLLWAPHFPIERPLLKFYCDAMHQKTSEKKFGLG